MKTIGKITEEVHGKTYKVWNDEAEAYNVTSSAKLSPLNYALGSVGLRASIDCESATYILPFSDTGFSATLTVFENTNFQIQFKNEDGEVIHSGAGTGGELKSLPMLRCFYAGLQA